MSTTFLDRCVSSRQRVRAAFALVAVLAACGSGGDDGAQPSTPTPAPAPPQSFVIDFGEEGSPAACTRATDGTGPIVECWQSPLSQDFADVAGVVDVSFAMPRFSTPAQPLWSLIWYAGGFNDLYGVACSGAGTATGSQGRIDIRAVDPRAVVKLDSFYLGGQSVAGRWSSTANIFALDSGTLLFTYTGPIGTGEGRGTASLFTPGVEAVGGIRIEWQDTSFYVCIDRIAYSVTTP